MGWWLSIQQSLLPKCHGHLRSASQRTRTAHLLPATSPTEALSPGAWGRRYLPQGGGCLFLGSLTFTTGHKTDPSKTGHLENAGQREASCGREKQGCEEEITHRPSQSAEVQKQTNKRRNVLSEDLEEGVRMLSTHFKHRDSGRLRNRWTETKAAAAARVRGAGSGRGGRGGTPGASSQVAAGTPCSRAVQTGACWEARGGFAAKHAAGAHLCR